MVVIVISPPEAELEIHSKDNKEVVDFELVDTDTKWSVMNIVKQSSGVNNEIQVNAMMYII